MNDPKQIRLGTLRPDARDRILAIYLQERAATVMAVTLEDLQSARDYIDEPSGQTKGAFTRVMTKLLADDHRFRQGVSKRITALVDTVAPAAKAHVNGGKVKRGRR